MNYAPPDMHYSPYSSNTRLDSSLNTSSYATLPRKPSYVANTAETYSDKSVGIVVSSYATLPRKARFKNRTLQCIPLIMSLLARKVLLTLQELPATREWVPTRPSWKELLPLPPWGVPRRQTDTTPLTHQATCLPPPEEDGKKLLFSNRFFQTHSL